MEKSEIENIQELESIEIGYTTEELEVIWKALINQTGIVLTNLPADMEQYNVITSALQKTKEQIILKKQENEEIQ